MDRKIDGWMDLGRWVGRWVGEREREREREVYLMIWLISVVLTAQQSSDKPLKIFRNIFLQTHTV